MGGVVLGYVLFAAGVRLPGGSRPRVHIPTCSGCNIVMIAIDPLRADGIHALGNPRRVTPTIDALAKNGFLFTNAFTVSSWTLPSAMSLFTGMYPSAHRIINKELIGRTQEEGLIPADIHTASPEVMTLAAILKENGYVTGGFAGGAALASSYGFDEGFDAYNSPGEFDGLDAVMPGAIEFVARHSRKRLFLFVQGFDTHGQYTPPEGISKKYVSSYEGSLTGTAKEQKALREEGVIQGGTNLMQGDADFLRAVYDEKIEYMDKRLASFLSNYHKLTGDKQTIFVITSNHGEAFYEHGFIDHGMTLYDEMIHVPLVMTIPGVVSGRNITDQVRNIDIFPTLVSLIGIHPPKSLASQWDGVSLVPTLEGYDQRLDLFTETEYRYAVFLQALRTWDGWKLIYDRQALVYKLFHVSSDPGEKDDVLWSSDMGQELTGRLIRWIDSVQNRAAGFVRKQ